MDSTAGRRVPFDTDLLVQPCRRSIFASRTSDTGVARDKSRHTTPRCTHRIANRGPFSQLAPSCSSRIDDHVISVLAGAIGVHSYLPGARVKRGSLSAPPAGSVSPRNLCLSTNPPSASRREYRGFKSDKWRFWPKTSSLSPGGCSERTRCLFLVSRASRGPRLWQHWRGDKVRRSFDD